MSEIKIAIAQFTPFKDDIENNIAIHLKLIESAIKKNVEIIIFPELSLTGYEPELASKLCFSESSIYNLPFQSLSTQNNLIIGVGMPIAQENEKPNIATILFFPDKAPLICHKINLHETEQSFFSHGKKVGIFSYSGIKFGVAICFDSLIETFIYSLKKMGVNYCLVPSLITKKGFEHDIKLLQQYAKKFQMGMIISNYIGKTGNMFGIGKSLIIDKNGKLQKQAMQINEGIITSFCN
jgi:predicted amidohydrolase